MKAAPARALLFVVGLILIGLGLAPVQVGPAAAAPLLLVTETPTTEPPSPTFTNTPTPANQPPPVTNTPTNTPETPPPPPPPPITYTPTVPPQDSPGDDDDDPDDTPTPTPLPSLTPTAPPPGLGPDPAISKSVSPASALIGDTVTYTILVTNLGGATATGVTVDDTLPSFVVPIEATATRGSVAVEGQRVRAELGDLAPGESVELRVSARVVAAAAAPNNLNLATVASTSPDANPGNNQASAPLDAAGPVSLPSTGVEESALPLLVTGLGLALIAASLLLGRSRPRRR